MSLEDAINDNTAAIRELIKHLGAAPAGVGADTKPAADKPKATATKPAAAKTPDAPALDFKTVIAPAFVAMVKAKGAAGPQAAADLLKGFGLDAAAGGKLSHVPAEKHAELYAAIQAASA